MQNDLRRNDVDDTTNRVVPETNPSTLDRDPATDSNPDAITGAPGSHPIGTGIGAASAGAAGALIGSVVPGIGTVVGGAIGAVVGAVAGGYAGKAVAEAVNPSVEDDYWRSNHANRPYYDKQYGYETDYRPAYQYGWESKGQYAGRTFDDAHSDLEQGWDKSKGESRLGWDKAKHAAKEAWNRLEGSAKNVKNEVQSHLPGSAHDDSVRTNPDVSQAAGFDTRLPSAGMSNSAGMSDTSATPPSMPGSQGVTGASGAKSDPSHRDTGTSNVRTVRDTSEDSI